jgi:altronate hydrolase
VGETVPQFVRHPVLRLNAADDVVIALREIAAGTRLEAEGVTTSERIPPGHKVATRAVAQGSPVRRYDQIIGFATKPIAPGQHVHVHNLEVREFERDYAFGTATKPTPQPSSASCAATGASRRATTSP